MCHHAEEGFCWASRTTLTDETLLSGSTIQRCQDRLAELGEISECSEHGAPALYLSLPKNRRPRLWELTGFLGSHFADSVNRRAKKPGSSRGARRVLTGSHATPSDLAVSNAIGNRLSDNTSASLSENDKPPDPACIRCHGSGELYGYEYPRRCTCTYVADPALSLADLS